MRPAIGILLVAAALAGCAGAYTPSENARALRTGMSAEQASRIIADSVGGANQAWGACLIGFNPGAVLNYSEPVTVQGATITFSGRVGKGQILGKTLLPDTQIEALRPQFEERTMTVNAASLKELRILSERVQNLQTWCPNVRAGYVVVLKPEAGLPADAEFCINVKTSRELDSLVAALTYLSPDARLVGGAGM